jgi:hypothetical protein
MESDFKAAIDAYKSGDATLSKTRSVLDALYDSTDKLKNGLGSLSDAFNNFSKLAINETKTLEGVVSSINSFTNSLTSAGESLKSLSTLGSTVALDVIFKNTIDPASQVLRTISTMASAGLETVKVFDGMDAGTRELNSNQFKLAANIGLGFDQAKRFGEVYKDIVSSNSELAQKGFYINALEFQAATKALQEQGFAMDALAESSGAAANGLNNVQAMTMQAKAMGKDVQTYAKEMGDMVRKSGLSMEDSMKLMASTQDISRDTGLRVDEVTQSLNSATSGFQRMGTTIGFGMPLLKGFASSITEVGLGISQAGDLAADFSKNLLNIVNNPALAYIASMKGGFSGSMGGGGGVLNPSIQMQAMMMDQGPGAQEELAKNLSIGMRETLKSFSGGDIISVKQAAASPELQSRFYTQQQMLGSQFGISDTATQNRVLEYLQKLEEATYAGDEEAAASFERQIAEAAKGNNQTMSIQEKMSLAMDQSVIIAQEQLGYQKGILTATLMGVTNKDGTEGENDFVSKFGTVASQMSGLLKKNDLSRGGDDLAKELAALANRSGLPTGINAEVPPASVTGAGELGAARVTSNVPPPAANQTNVNITVTDGTKSGIAVTSGKTSSTATVATTP